MHWLIYGKNFIIIKKQYMVKMEHTDTDTDTDIDLDSLMFDLFKNEILCQNAKALVDTPLEIEINIYMHDRLKDMAIYKALDKAMELHNIYSKNNRKPYPILGNTIQIIFEYINGNIGEFSFQEFHEKLENTADEFMDLRKKGWYEFPIIAFFTPPSYKKKEKYIEMGLLSDNSIILDKYNLLKKLEKKYNSKS